MCLIAPFEETHAEGMIAVVRSVHAEYGFSWEADGYHRDLYTVEQSYLHGGGMFWIALAGHEVVGCAGLTLHGRQCELHRLYLLRAFRGRGLGRRLLDTAIEYGRERGCDKMIAWSDVKLTDAHALYLRTGFIQEDQRICNDPDKAREYGFWRHPL